MADLYNLLEELDDDNVQIKAGRPSTETAATELLTEDWEETEQVEGPSVQQAERDYEKGVDTSSKSYDDYDNALRDENKDYLRLQHHWVQERQCPELLDYDKDLVEDYKLKLEEQQDWIDQLEASESVDSLVISSLAQVDLDRAKFVVSDWLTSRLAKIEEHPLYMRKMIDKMSDAEVAYLQQYGALLEHHLRETVLDHVPEAWQALDEPNMIDEPNLEEYHFWKVHETVDINGRQEEAEACLVAKYKEMKEYMAEGKVELQL